jgi:hypothetical protein
MYFECGAWLLYQTTKPDIYRQSDAMIYSQIGAVYMQFFKMIQVGLT